MYKLFTNFGDDYNKVIETYITILSTKYNITTNELIELWNKLIPIKIDFKNRRNCRQKKNNMVVLSSIKENNIDNFYKYINQKELTRFLEEWNMTIDLFWKKCREDDDFSKLVSYHFSIKSSRQGSTDEKEQIMICNIISKNFGIHIESLHTTDIRPYHNEVINKQEMKKRNIKKDECLKSFDGKISGVITGYMSCKVVYGYGGHQDNVFDEMNNLLEWWCKYKINSIEMLFIIIDTDLFDKFDFIKEKYKQYNNIKVFNHLDFQTYIISNFSLVNI